MKKFAIFALIALLAIGTVSAQDRGWGGGPPPETVRVEGTLQLQQGQIALSTGTEVYFIPGLMRYVGFIEGLREGARVTVEGFAYRNFLRPSKFTVGGREYDLLGDAPGWGDGGPGWGRGHGYCPRWGGGYGPRGGYGHKGGHHWGPRGGRW